MTNPILVTGAAGRVGGVERTVTELFLKQGQAVRAMARTEDERALALRDLGAEIVAGDLLDLESMHRVFEGAWPSHHLSGHSSRVVAGPAAQAWLADPPGLASRDDGRSAPRGTL